MSTTPAAWSCPGFALADDDLFVHANYAEAGLWSLIGVSFLAVALRRRTGRLLLLSAAAAFIAFGLSYVVETRTGAWWRPWWLLAWKGLCVLALGALFWRYRQRRSRAGQDPT